MELIYADAVRALSEDLNLVVTLLLIAIGVSPLVGTHLGR